jgi:hypothetical protein
MAKPQDDGREAEYKVRSVLLTHGRKVQLGRHNEPFDLLIDGKTRIEVKTCGSVVNKGVPRWFFNVHRHGTLDESEVDAYVLRMENVPFSKYAMHLLFLSPVGKKAIVISARSLLNQYLEKAIDFQRFCKTGELPQKNGAK